MRECLPASVSITNLEMSLRNAINAPFDSIIKRLSALLSRPSLFSLDSAKKADESTPFLPVPVQGYLPREADCTPYSDVCDFPEAWERWLQPWDDRLIAMVQSQYPTTASGEEWGKTALYCYARIATGRGYAGLFPVEVGYSVAFSLYATGNEEYAVVSKQNAWMIGVGLTAVTSQVIKRFVFRTRPGRTAPPRAMMGRSETTSSMPSRAVLCTVVFTYLVLASLNHSLHNTAAGIFSWNFHSIHWAAVLCIVLALSVSSSYARVFLGMHYPSDCAAGFVLGVGVIAASAGLYHMPLFDCPPCVNSDCYAGSSNSISFSSGDWVRPIVVRSQLVARVPAAFHLSLRCPPPVSPPSLPLVQISLHLRHWHCVPHL